MRLYPAVIQCRPGDDLEATLAYCVVVLVTLGLAIGANTAVFRIVNAVLLRSRPYRDPGQLILFNEPIRLPVARSRSQRFAATS